MIEGSALEVVRWFVCINCINVNDIKGLPFFFFLVAASNRSRASKKKKKEGPLLASGSLRGQGQGQGRLGVERVEWTARGMCKTRREDSICGTVGGSSSIHPF